MTVRRHWHGHEGVPMLKLAYDGVERASETTVLEAFVHQAREYMLSKDKVHT